MRSADELKAQLRTEWENVISRIRLANGDLAERLATEPLTFDLDIADDELTITIGTRPTHLYVQSIDDVRLEVDDEGHRIASIVIEGYSTYGERHAHEAIYDMAPLLRRVRRLELPAESDRDDVARELGALVTA